MDSGDVARMHNACRMIELDQKGGVRRAIHHVGNYLTTAIVIARLREQYRKDGRIDEATLANRIEEELKALGLIPNGYRPEDDYKPPS